MRTIIWIAALCALMVGAGGVAWSQSNESTRIAEKEIRSTREASNRAIAKRDIGAFAASLEPDFVMVRGTGVLVPSKDQYVALFAEDFAKPELAIRYERVAETVEVSAVVPLAAEHGHWTGTRADGTLAYSGTYEAMWRHTVSGWKIRSELFVTLN